MFKVGFAGNTITDITDTITDIADRIADAVGGCKTVGSSDCGLTRPVQIRQRDRETADGGVKRRSDAQWIADPFARKTVDALQADREAPVLGSLPFVWIGRGQIFGERQRHFRGRRGRVRGGRAMEGGAGFHGDEGARAAASSRPRGGEVGLELVHGGGDAPRSSRVTRANLIADTCFRCSSLIDSLLEFAICPGKIL